jgi:hypothetical protein
VFEILRDPLWQFVGVVVALGAIAISIILYMKSRSRKSLAYSIVSITRLLSVKTEIKKDLQMFYKGKPIEQVHLVLVKIVNNGNLPVTANDFERPFSLQFKKNTQILNAEVANANPSSLQPSIKVEEQKIIVDPILLNSSDSVTLKLLVSKLTCDFDVDARVVGVREIREIGGTSFRSWVFIGLASFSGLFGYLIGSIGKDHFFLTLLITVISGVILTLVAFLTKQKKTIDAYR